MDNFRNNKVLFGWLFRGAVAVALMATIFLKSDLEDVARALRSIGIVPFVTIFAAHVLHVYLLGVKWRLLLPEYGLKTLIKVILVGFFYSIVLPGQIAGEVMKAYRLGKGSGQSEKVASSVLVDKVTGLIPVLLIGMVGIYGSSLDVPELILVSMALVTAVGVLVLFMMRIDWIFKASIALINKLRYVSRRMHKVWALMEMMLIAWRHYLHDRGLIFKSLVAGLALHAPNVLIIYVIAKNIGVSVSLVDWLWVFSAVSVITIIPLSIGGIGIREGAFVGLLAFLNVPQEQALAISLVLLGIQLSGAVLGGVVELIGSRHAR